MLFDGEDIAFDEVRVDCFDVGSRILVVMADIVYLKCSHEVTDNACVVVPLAHAIVDVVSDGAAVEFVS